ncbi:microsomal triglyceride transfer protein large subunit [Brienomyrus brachyistius]|uniref:microsomal triglyceride transfer protein large subunit n=1 Tax=Brienomyrus brachyistius TaxID=42636 RepID=UPI0020B3AF4D|nr:microsomal triglyceride transfer protein large subunit [Brienomyrus brachyistius]
MLRSVLIFLCTISPCFSASVEGGVVGPRLSNGQLYKFSYSTEVLLDRAKGSSESSAGYRVSSSVDINLVWRNPSSKDDQLLKVLIGDVKIENVAPRPEKKDILAGSTTQSILGKGNLETLQRPFLVHWKLGKVKGLYSYQNEPAVIRNFKRGVASLLQLQLTSGKVEEVDVSGRCTVEYKAGKDQVTRVKLLDSCKTAETGFTTLNPVLGVSGKSSSITEFTLHEGFIKSAVSEETHIISVNARRTIATKVVSRQSLVLVKKEAGPQESAGKQITTVIKSLDANFVAITPLPPKGKHHCKGCPSLWEHWRRVHKDLEPERLSRATGPRTFLGLIQTLRRTSKEEILRVLRNSTKTALPQLVDSVTSAQTPASMEALLEFIDFSNSKQLVLQERFLYACGFASHPNEDLLKSLLGLWKGKIASTDIRESVMIILGALVRKLCQKGGCDLPTVVEVKNLILEGPDSTKVESEVQMYLLAMKNALVPEAIPVLTKYAESEVGACSTIAITALQRYNFHLITEEVKRTLNRIYHQNRRVFEKNVRAAAADVIFSSSPSYMEVKNLLLSIGHLPQEMNKYMLSKVQDILRFEMPASKVIKKVLKDMNTHNYDRFSKLGSSSAFSGYMTKETDITTIYNLDLLYSGSGVLRRSNMNIFALSGGFHLHGLQVAIEAQGLESLIAATADEGEEELESFAGMSALLFDVQLRPVTFFKGYSDLMSKMFSMSGDPMNVVKGLILLLDHSQVLQLQSGLKASIEFQGGLAIDISGGMEISLWYRESKTSVNNRGALVMNANVTVDLEFARAGMEVSFESEASLDFVTTVQFSEYPFLVCLQMDKATFPFRETLTKYEGLPSGKSFTSRKGRKGLVPGSEFPLHQENSNMCKKVFEG